VLEIFKRLCESVMIWVNQGQLSEKGTNHKSALNHFSFLLVVLVKVIKISVSGIRDVLVS